MSTIPLDKFRAAIRDVDGFPKPGIVFKDITPLLSDPVLLTGAADQMADAFRQRNVEKVLAIESRGFLFGFGLAERLRAGLALARKPGKLPWNTRRVEYALEYGSDALEMHDDALAAGQQVLIVDDVLATGGTAAAAARLIEEAGGVVTGFSFLAELAFLGGRERLGDRPIESLLTFE